MLGEAHLLGNLSGEDSIPDSGTKGLPPKADLLDDKRWSVDDDEDRSSRMDRVLTPGNGSLWTNYLLCEPGVSKRPATSHMQAAKAGGVAASDTAALGFRRLPFELSRDGDGDKSEASIQVGDVSMVLCEQSLEASAYEPASATADLDRPAAELVFSSNLKDLYRYLRTSDTEKTGFIVADDVAGICIAASQSLLQQPLNDEMRRDIAERAKALLLKSGQFGQSSISIALWMHYALLEKVDLPSQLKGPVEESAQQAKLEVLATVVELWLEADVACRAYLPEEKFLEKLSVSVRAEIVDMFRDQDADGRSVFSYVAFCAMELGIHYEPVDMYFYDLVQRTGGAFLFRPIMNRSGLDGVWHTSIVVFGTEIYVLGDLRVSAPQNTEFGLPKKFMRLGCTLKSEQAFFDHIEEELSPMFRKDTYDLMENNCNHFCDQACEFLLGKHIPDTVRNQSQLILEKMNHRIVRVGRMLLNCWLHRCHQRALKKAAGVRNSRSTSLCIDDLQKGLRQRNVDGKQQSMMKLYSNASADSHYGFAATESRYGAAPSIPYSQFGTMQTISQAASISVSAEKSYRTTM